MSCPCFLYLVVVSNKFNVCIPLQIMIMEINVSTHKSVSFCVVVNALVKSLNLVNISE